MGIENSVKEKFDGREVGIGDPFNSYENTLSRVGFMNYPDQTIEEQNTLYSKQLANNRIIMYRGDNGEYLTRHLKHDEYNRISELRNYNGYGRLKNYSDVKCYTDNKYIPVTDMVKEVAQELEF